MQKPKLIVVLGPTTTGKSALAVDIARAVDGEIVSADSRQVYRGMNLGTGKITKREMRSIPHHLLDVANPKRQFSVAQYAKLADRAIADIIRRGKTPIICGGTGFYIDTLVSGAGVPDVPPNPSLRKTLASLSAEKLFFKLQKIDPDRAKTIDANNPVRLIRAIEIATTLGSVPPINRTQKYTVLSIGLNTEDAVLKEKIRIRLHQRMKAGMLAEAKHLRAEGLSWKRFFSLGLEYRALGKFLQEKISRADMLEMIEKETWQYVRRQRTWFRNKTETIWLDSSKKSDLKKSLTLAKAFLKK